MRDWIQKNSNIICILSVLAMTIALVWHFALSGPPSIHNSDLISDQCWYYDVATGRYLRDRIDRVPPFLSDKGAEQVRVVFFSCGACNESEWFPGYYLKYTPELTAKVQADPSLMSTLHGESVPGRMFSLDGRIWVAAPDVEKAGVYDHHRNRCDGKGALKMCR